jgi:hypothetical protein
VLGAGDMDAGRCHCRLPGTWTKVCVGEPLELEGLQRCGKWVSLGRQ